VTSLHFSPEATDQEPSKWLLSGSSDETLKVWNVSDIDLVKESLFSSAYCAAFPSGTGESLMIASAGTDNCLQVT
jgi:WD40 repeat protein